MTGKMRALHSIQAPGRLSVEAGQTVDADDPIVKGREHLFEPVKKPAKKKPAKKKSAG